MRLIRNIAIVGAGAMGAAYASMFSDAGEFAVVFVAEGERHARLKRQGVTANGLHYDVPVVAPGDMAAAPVDLVLVALKHHHLPAALPQINRLVGGDTVILSVTN